MKTNPGTPDLTGSAPSISVANQYGAFGTTGQWTPGTEALDGLMGALEKKRAQRALLATALGVEEEELSALRRQITAAESGLAGSKAAKASLAARRLSITPAELAVIRAALTDHSVARSQRARSLAMKIASLPPIWPKPTANKRGAGPAKTSDTRRTSSTGRVGPGWGPDTNVFVTDWGDVVHLRADCHGTRGFRQPGDPDPVVRQVHLRNPICGQRRACRKCFDVWSSSAIDQLDHELESLHGRRGLSRPRSPGQGRSSPVTIRWVAPTPGAVAPKRYTEVPAARTKPTKAERDRRVAAEEGITVDQLKARRRAEADRARQRSS